MRTRHMAVSARVIVLLAGMLAASAALAQTVRVTVSGSTDGNHVTTYSYRVINGSSQPVVGIKIGFDSDSGEPQLGVFPAGWTVQNGLPQSSSTSPAGWTALVVTMEENPNVDVEWNADGGPQFDVAPGATAGGFSIKVPQGADAYHTAKFEAILGDSTRVDGSLEPEDTTPPALQVTVDPSVLWPPNHKMVSVTANVTATDDFDAHPVVKLVSITSNETLQDDDVAGAAYGTDDRQFTLRASRSGAQKEGRVYTVTYSATDANGNTATATATVTVPHDQR
ncbi:MAG TPA: hypothetical protein VLV86_13705 [Vicinamibacterales bacterium]|nr:hypothetical protein [Vicinamibacterales bacterium]